jgi:hypothetical protein
MRPNAIALVPALWLCAVAADAARKPDQGQPDFRLNPESGKGLLVASLSMPSISHGHLANMRCSLHYRQLSAGRARSFAKRFVLERESFVTGRTIRSDFDKPVFGVVFAAELPAGQYELTHWLLDGNTTPILIKSDGNRPIPFEVRPGRVTYMGNLDLEIGTGKNLLRQNVLVDAGVALSDQEERDVAILLRKFPLIEAKDVDVEVIVDSTWQTREERDEPATAVPVKP